MADFPGPRSKVLLWWSTAPRHVGYPGQGEKNDLGTMRPDFEGTPRQVLKELARVRRNIGQGTLLATIIEHNGNLYTIDDLKEITRDR